jgi:hypothetical protein
MEKEEGEKGHLQEKELPFIPFSGGSKCQLSHDELATSLSRPEPMPSVSHLTTDPAPGGQANVMLRSSSSSERLVLVCESLVSALPGADAGIVQGDRRAWSSLTGSGLARRECLTSLHRGRRGGLGLQRRLVRLQIPVVPEH